MRLEAGPVTTRMEVHAWLMEHPGSRLTEICEGMGISKSAACNAVAHLRREGAISAIKCTAVVLHRCRGYRKDFLRMADISLYTAEPFVWPARSMRHAAVRSEERQAILDRDKAIILDRLRASTEPMLVARIARETGIHPVRTGLILSQLRIDGEARIARVIRDTPYWEACRCRGRA